MILVIDDEQMIRSLAQKILSKAGYEVLQAESGEEGLALLEADVEKIKLVIVDMTMDGLSGTETLREMRKMNPDLPGVISTGHALELTDLPDDIQTNTYLLTKPYRASEIKERVEMILSVVPGAIN